VRLTIKCILVSLCIFITGEVHADCSVFSTNITFGTYDAFLNTPRDSTGTITVTCDLAPPPYVSISIGPSPNSGGFSPRQMKHASQPDRLNYNLFTDASMTAVWGDGTRGTTTVTVKVTKGKPGIATIYARIPAGQDVSVGQYGEILTVTITW
jgi:spore coat protein U-like protein